MAVSAHAIVTIRRDSPCVLHSVHCICSICVHCLDNDGLDEDDEEEDDPDDAADPIYHTEVRILCKGSCELYTEDGRRCGSF
jgi:hypothetical protein